MGERHTDCYCNHLTYFTVLVVRRAGDTQLNRHMLGKISSILVNEGVVALLIALCPFTATAASTSAPPAGADCYYISGLRRVCGQLCRSHHLSLQEEVMVMRCRTGYRQK